MDIEDIAPLTGTFGSESAVEAYDEIECILRGGNGTGIEIDLEESILMYEGSYPH